MDEAKKILQSNRLDDVLWLCSLSEPELRAARGNCIENEEPADPMIQMIQTMMGFLQQQTAAQREFMQQQMDSQRQFMEEMRQMRRGASPPKLPVQPPSGFSIPSGDLPPLPTMPVQPQYPLYNSQAAQFHQFAKLKTPHFTRTDDPAEAERWLERVDKDLTVIGCDVQYRVPFATYLLDGEARQWWKSLERCLDLPISWERFVVEFNAKYFRRWYRDKKEEEFLNLEQRSMTVMQYESRFIELSRFSSDLVDTEQKKMKKFERGLRMSIRNKVRLCMCATYHDMVERSIMIEEGEAEELRASKVAHTKLQAFRHSIVLGKRKVGGMDFAQLQYAARSRSNRQQTEPVCYRCRIPGHISRTCTKILPFQGASQPSFLRPVHPVSPQTGQGSLASRQPMATSVRSRES